jgi:hypothetical protein
MRKYRKHRMVCDNNNLRCDVQTASAVSPPASEHHRQLVVVTRHPRRGGEPTQGLGAAAV